MLDPHEFGADWALWLLPSISREDGTTSLTCFPLHSFSLICSLLVRCIFFPPPPTPKVDLHRFSENKSKSDPGSIQPLRRRDLESFAPVGRAGGLGSPSFPHTREPMAGSLEAEVEVEKMGLTL